MATSKEAEGNARRPEDLVARYGGEEFLCDWGNLREDELELRLQAIHAMWRHWTLNTKVPVRAPGDSASALV